MNSDFLPGKYACNVGIYDIPLKASLKFSQWKANFLLSKIHVGCKLFSSSPLPPSIGPLGEITVACANKAQQVLYYTATADFPCQSVTGKLLCTNFRCCFVPDPVSVERVRETFGRGHQSLVYMCSAVNMNIQHSQLTSQRGGGGCIIKSYLFHLKVCPSTRRVAVMWQSLTFQPPPIHHANILALM